MKEEAKGKYRCSASYRYGSSFEINKGGKKLISISKVKMALAAIASAALIATLLAGCGGGTTTVTVGGGSTATTTKTVTTTAAGGGGGAGAGASLTVYGDMVTNVGCLEINIGHRGELIVWRTRVVDPVTGKDMTDKDLKSVQAVLPDGLKFDEVYGGHPGGGTPTDYFWSAPWEVPLTYPTGSLGYQVNVVANDGRTGSYKPFEVAASKLTIANYDPAFVRAWSVNITATGFSVATITASQGSKITFTNKDTIPHKVTGDGWDSGDIAATKAFARVFSTPGTFIIKDTANPAATLTIIVNPAPTS
jgi:plastocyanin